MNKFFLAFCLLLAVAVAGGYLKSSNIASDLISATDGAILNNPYKLFSAVGAMSYAWFMCTWPMIFGGDYTSCVYTHVYYAIQ